MSVGLAVLTARRLAQTSLLQLQNSELHGLFELLSRAQLVQLAPQHIFFSHSQAVPAQVAQALQLQLRAYCLVQLFCSLGLLAFAQARDLLSALLSIFQFRYEPEAKPVWPQSSYRLTGLKAAV